MKTRILTLVLALGAVLFVAGCDTVGEPLARRFNPTPVKQVVEAPIEKVFPAAVAALKEMGYKIRRATQKEGVIEAYGRLDIDDSFRSSSQHNCRVVITALLDGSCDVQIEVRDQVEEHTGAGGLRQTEQVRPFGGIHQRFYDEVHRRL